MELIDTIGNTKLLDLTTSLKEFTFRQGSSPALKAQNSLMNQPFEVIPQGSSIFAKCEHLNPTGSVKDRIAAYMIQRAEEKGELKQIKTLIESTSGNTGAAVAMISAIKGYHAILVVPDRVSQEKQATLRALGAEVIVMPSTAHIDSVEHYMNTAQRLAQNTPNSFYLNQYQSPHNAAAHYHTTGPEIWAQTQGKIDVFVSVIGSGGTLSGVGRYLKERKPHIKIIAVDPVGSVYTHYFKQGILPPKDTITASQIEGAGSDHMTQSIDFSVVDDIIQFSDEDAFYTAKWLANNAGLLVGGSSGANIWAALQIAQNTPHPTQIVTIFPDNGMKYISKLY